MSAKILWIGLLAVLIASSQIRGENTDSAEDYVPGKRISQIKCEEYINATMTTVSLIPMTLNPTPTHYTSYNCAKTVDLIVGGEEAKKAEFRHQALLGWKTNATGVYQFDCGGTVISERYVLTAAHCGSRGNHDYAAPVIVRFAEHDLTKEEEEFDIEIERFIRYPQHRFGRSYHDIALVRLKNRLQFTAFVRPACLWDDEDLNATSVIATGFGLMDFGDNHGSDTLRKVQLDVMDMSECSHQFLGLRSFRTGVSDDQLCIGSTRGGKDTCQGDSGGPVQVLVNPKGCIYHVVGVTSTGSACGSNVAVYTKVANYIDWIEKVVWGPE